MLAPLVLLVVSQPPGPVAACVKATTALQEHGSAERRAAALAACAQVLPTSCRAAWSAAQDWPEPQRRARLADACRGPVDAGAPTSVLATSELRGLYRALLVRELGASVDAAMGALEIIDAQSLGFPFSRACQLPPSAPTLSAPSLDKRPIGDVIRAALPRLRACWDKPVDSKQPRPLGFTIGSDGRVCSVRGEVRDPASAEACLHRALETLVFRPPAGGGIVIVSYPLNVDPTE